MAIHLPTLFLKFFIFCFSPDHHLDTIVNVRGREVGDLYFVSNRMLVSCSSEETGPPAHPIWPN